MKLSSFVFLVTVLALNASSAFAGGGGPYTLDGLGKVQAQQAAQIAALQKTLASLCPRVAVLEKDNKVLKTQVKVLQGQVAELQGKQSDNKAAMDFLASLMKLVSITPGDASSGWVDMIHVSGRWFVDQGLFVNWMYTGYITVWSDLIMAPTDPAYGTTFHLSRFHDAAVSLFKQLEDAVVCGIHPAWCSAQAICDDFNSCTTDYYNTSTGTCEHNWDTYCVPCTSDNDCKEASAYQVGVNNGKVVSTTCNASSRCDQYIDYTGADCTLWIHYPNDVEKNIPVKAGDTIVDTTTDVVLATCQDGKIVKTASTDKMCYPYMKVGETTFPMAFNEVLSNDWDFKVPLFSCPQ